MAERRRRIAVVPARAGSVRLPGKNLERVGGMALVERAVMHATAARADLTIVSTDDPRVTELVSTSQGVELLERPADLAGSEATTDSVLHHVLDWAGAEDDALVMLLQPTSPFRTRSLLRACIEAAEAHLAMAAVSVARISKNPGWIRCLDEDGRLSQGPVGCAPVTPTGAVYAFGCGAFRNCGTLAEMEKIGVLSDIAHACDIDEQFELVTARALADAGLGDDVIDLVD